MSLTASEVARIAHLARLSLTPEEIASYQEQLSKVLDYVDQIAELDLRGVPPTTGAVRRVNVWREDVVGASLDRADALFNAPESADDQFRLQAILGEDA